MGVGPPKLTVLALRVEFIPCFSGTGARAVKLLFSGGCARMGAIGGGRMGVKMGKVPKFGRRFFCLKAIKGAVIELLSPLEFKKLTQCVLRVSISDVKLRQD